MSFEGKANRKLANGQNIEDSEKRKWPKGLSAPVLELNTIIFKHVYWYMQLISGERLQDHWSSGCYLIICDLVAALNLFWSVLLRFRNTPYWLCAIKTFLSSSAQIVSYYHMLAVCIHRFRKLRKIDLPRGNNDKYRYGIESLFIWIVVLLLSLPPFVTSARNEDLPGPPPIGARRNRWAACASRQSFFRC